MSTCPRCAGWMDLVHELEGWEWHCAICSHTVEAHDPAPSRLRPHSEHQRKRYGRDEQRRCLCGQPIAQDNARCLNCYFAWVKARVTA